MDLDEFWKAATPLIMQIQSIPTDLLRVMPP